MGNKNAFSRIVKASNYFTQYDIERVTLEANTQYIIDLGGFYDRVRITVDGVDTYVRFDGDSAVTLANGYQLIGNEKHIFDLRIRYIRLISAGTPTVYVIGLR